MPQAWLLASAVARIGVGLQETVAAIALGVPAPRINDVMRERPGVTVDSALRLARYSCTISEFWTGQQADHDLRIAESSAKKTLAKIKLGLSHELIV